MVEDGFVVFPTHVGVNHQPSISMTTHRVFPTHVGVNRLSTKMPYTGQGLPHACGGEPADDEAYSLKF